MTAHHLPPAARGSDEPIPVAERVPLELQRAAVKRLVATDQPDPEGATDRFLAAALQHGIDLRLMWIVRNTSPRAGDEISEVALIARGAGATGMMFCSKPRRRSGDDGHRDRTAVIQGVCREVNDDAPQRIRIVQCLPEPHETWAQRACADAGMTSVGTLEYLRRRRSSPALKPVSAPWPNGIEMTRVSDLQASSGALDLETEHGASVDDMLSKALERTYADTLDCPELSGLRATSDILASHRSTGEHDPRTWWVVTKDGEPEGCVLLSRSPELMAVELVYIGLSPRIRGLGLGRRVLTLALADAAEKWPGHEVTCAMDSRNAPARSIYTELGFRKYSERRPFVTAI